MKKGMCITYEVDGALYINLTNKCSNNCDFCIRRNGDGAYGSEPLWLLREPTVEEVKTAVFLRDIPSYREVVFCGYGEPSYRLNVAREVALAIKDRYPKTKVRINTNGHSSLIWGRDTTPDYKDAFDVVSISLNTPSPEKYVEMCHPVYNKTAYFAMLEFAKNVKNYVHSVLLSVVKETLTENELLECQKIADSVGVTLKVRTYIGPNEE